MANDTTDIPAAGLCPNCLQHWPNHSTGCEPLHRIKFDADQLARHPDQLVEIPKPQWEVFHQYDDAALPEGGGWEPLAAYGVTENGAHGFAHSDVVVWKRLRPEGE